MATIGIRRETKSHWERRVAITPALARELVEGGTSVLVESSEQRVFEGSEFTAAGAELVDDLSGADVVFGVKEMPNQIFRSGCAYLFFAHVIKGQSYNMGMLQAMLDRGATLIDYERIADDQGRRLVFFGPHAGMAGMVDALWALGRRLEHEGIESVFEALQPAFRYPSYEVARSAVAEVGQRIATEGVGEALHPLIIGVAGYGNVAKGVQDVLSALPTVAIRPDQVAGIACDKTVDDKVIYRVTFKEEHLVRPAGAGASFELQEYYDHPERYTGDFAQYLPHLSVLVNCIYWTTRYPRLVRLGDLPAMARCRVISDISCDIGGAIEATVKSTDPGDPVFVYDPVTGEANMGVEGEGPVICAVDILPAELPREASETFSKALRPFAQAVAAADYSVDFEALDLPPEIKRAVVVHRGELTPSYAYLAASL